MIVEHLQERIDMEMYDFQDQLYRKITHELFSVVLSDLTGRRNTIRSFEILKNDCWEKHIKKQFEMRGLHM